MSISFKRQKFHAVSMYAGPEFFFYFRETFWLSHERNIDLSSALGHRPTKREAQHRWNSSQGGERLSLVIISLLSSLFSLAFILSSFLTFKLYKHCGFGLVKLMLIIDCWRQALNIEPLILPRRSIGREPRTNDLCCEKEFQLLHRRNKVENLVASFSMLR